MSKPPDRYKPECEIFVETTSPQMSVTVIRGVQYIVFSFFDGDKSVQEHLGGLIQSSFEAADAVEITSESLLDNGIAIPGETGYDGAVTGTLRERSKE